MASVNQFVVPVVDEALILKYDQPGPRYTSYPTAPLFTDRFTAADLWAEIEATNAAPQPPPLSLYFHLPFCESVCFFCGCNVTFTSDRTRPVGYTEILIREMDMIVPRLRPGRPVAQLHWGGGTPTFFSPPQLQALFDAIRSRFAFAEDAEIGIEIDPRETTPEHFDVLARCRFNRLSMGIQDFDPKVQQAVNRIQPEDLTRNTIETARQKGFSSISVDLIYGLPHQSEATFAKTLDAILRLDPDRIALFNFAYLPKQIRHQKAIEATALPSPREKLAILRRAIAEFTRAGYRFIGMDHFAKPDDPMCRAQDNGTLYRNFQGYTTHAGCDLFAFGVSAISSVGRTYGQNDKNSREYAAAIGAGRLAIVRGLRMSDEDILRREVIMRLMCDFALDMPALGARFGIDFPKHFAPCLEALRPLEADGLVRIADGRIEVSPAGRLLIRNICMAFDEHLAKTSAQFSRTV
ncbi:MAG TPA: oxygen-independent coproporphyrinogen III oxidase [Verrucomicrobiae bacterium]|nr:oxygen-independent coproporphyrinogen III oxidase [Verrucomicrobiae bacterium]